jgi:hypothetical protein
MKRLRKLIGPMVTGSKGVGMDGIRTPTFYGFYFFWRFDVGVNYTVRWVLRRGMIQPLENEAFMNAIFIDAEVMEMMISITKKLNRNKSSQRTFSS